MSINKLIVVIDNKEFEVVNNVKIIVEIGDHENDAAKFNPHSVEIHRTYTHKGFVTDLISDAYETGIVDNREVVASTWGTWYELLEEYLED